MFLFDLQGILTNLIQLQLTGKYTFDFVIESDKISIAIYERETGNIIYKKDYIPITTISGSSDPQIDLEIAQLFNRLFRIS